MSEPDSTDRASDEVPIDYIPIALRCFTYHIPPPKKKKRDKKRIKELFEQLMSNLPPIKNNPAS